MSIKKRLTQITYYQIKFCLENAVIKIGFWNKSAAIERMNQARNVNLQSLHLAKQAIDVSYQGMTNYLHEAMNLSDKKLEQLRDLYTE